MKNGKGEDLERRTVGRVLEELGKEAVIRVYCMKKIIFNNWKF